MFCCFSILKNVVPRTNIKKLQRMQTSVARVVLPNFSYHPATALLSELHSLPVNSRITFKLACLTYKLLTTGRPAYLHKQIHHYTLTRTLRSTDQLFLPSVCLSVCLSVTVTVNTETSLLSAWRQFLYLKPRQQVAPTVHWIRAATNKHIHAVLRLIKYSYGVEWSQAITNH